MAHWQIFERLKAEDGCTRGYLILKDHIRAAKIGSCQMFVPFGHVPDEAHASFGETVVIARGELKAHFSAFDLLHCDGCFAMLKSSPPEAQL